MSSTAESVTDTLLTRFSESASAWVLGHRLVRGVLGFFFSYVIMTEIAGVDPVHSLSRQ